MATSIASSMRTTTDNSTYRVKVDIAGRIELLDPNENPMTLISKKIHNVTANSFKHSWLEDSLRPEKDQINFDTGYASAATAITVDNGDYFAAGDLWQVYDSYEIMKVSSVASDIVHFTRNWANVSSGHTGYPTALEDNDYLLFIGNVNEEGSGAPTPVTTVETQVDNYTQIFKTPFELSETQRAVLLHAEQDLPYQARKAAIEHSRKIEKALLWGVPRSTTGTNSRPERGMGGLWWFLKENSPSANIVSQSELTKAEFLTWVRNVFRYGPRRKFLFACPLILSAIESWGLADLQTRPTDKTYGINTSRWTSPHGEIAIINHKMLEGPNPGTAGGWAFMLDMDKVAYAPLRTRDTKFESDIQDNDEDSYECQYKTEATMEIRLPEHHGVLYNVTSFAA